MLPSCKTSTSRRQDNGKQQSKCNTMIYNLLLSLRQLCSPSSQLFSMWKRRIHIQRICRSKQQGKPRQAPKTSQVHVDETADVLTSLMVHSMGKRHSDVTWVDLHVDGEPLKMEFDTGSAESITRYNLYNKKLADILCTKRSCS